jgi:hypothetical protein
MTSKCRIRDDAVLRNIAERTEWIKKLEGAPEPVISFKG